MLPAFQASFVNNFDLFILFSSIPCLIFLIETLESIAIHDIYSNFMIWFVCINVIAVVVEI